MTTPNNNPTIYTEHEVRQAWQAGRAPRHTKFVYSDQTDFPATLWDGRNQPYHLTELVSPVVVVAPDISTTPTPKTRKIVRWVALAPVGKTN